MIGVQVMQDLHEAKNMALKDEFMMQDQRRTESPRRNYGSDISRGPIDEGLIAQEQQPKIDHLGKEKAVGKQKVVDNKETPETSLL